MMNVMPSRFPSQTRANQVSFPESELIPIISKGRNIISPGTKQCAHEIDSGFGIADVVFYNFDSNSAKKRQRFGVPRIKSFEILETLSVINELGKDKLSVTQLYKKLPYSKNTFTKKILSFLLENKIAELENDRLNFKFKYQVSLKETTAIEAKVSNWKRGFYQAYRYKQYSDYSYLALHKKHISVPYKNIDLFVQFNIGLINVDPATESIDVLYTPQLDENIFSKWVRYYANESILDELGYFTDTTSSK